MYILHVILIMYYVRSYRQMSCLMSYFATTVIPVIVLYADMSSPLIYICTAYKLYYHTTTFFRPMKKGPIMYARVRYLVLYYYYARS
jgi:ABC-type Na+ efflux pump permease subunit